MFYCPRCKAKVPAEALYCTQCGFNATNARLKVAANRPATIPGSPIPNSAAPSLPGIPGPAPQSQPVQPGMPQPVSPIIPPPSPPATRSLQPETRRVVHQLDASVPLIAPISMAPSQLPANNGGQVNAAQSPVLAPALPHIPNTPAIATKGQLNPSIPLRPVPSHLQQPTHAHITPAHLMAIQQSPSAPSTPPALPMTVVALSSSAPLVQQQPVAPPQEMLQRSPVVPPQQGVAMSQQGHQVPQRQTEPPRPVTTSTPRSPESYIATRNAAERWRTSWRNKQHSEAGPATEVSRGQSSVPEPLMAMQHSLARIRAIVKPQEKKKSISIFWVSIILIVCFMIGLAAFILSTYLGITPKSTVITPPSPLFPPGLSARGFSGVAIQSGQILHVHGDHFAIGDPILFLLDGANSINGTDGKEIAIQVSNAGTFDVAIPVATSWSNGPHVIEAEDNKTGQTAYLSIQISSHTLSSVNSVPGLALSQSQLAIEAYIGQGNPAEQFLTLTNKSNTAMQWIAKAVTDDGLNWLAVDSATTGGTINAGSKAQVGIETLLNTLKNTRPPYTGDIIIGVNGREQLIVPVTLLVQQSAEWIFSPNPVIGVLSSQGGTCNAGATLTMINLGNVPIFWHILLGTGAANHIQFSLNGKLHMQGMLLPAGQSGDTQVLALECSNVQNGASYLFTIDANNILWHSAVLIQTS